MKGPDFFRFAGNRHATQDRPFNGLLQFIPQPEDRLQADVPRHAAFESTDLQWVEIKENISTEGVRVELLADSPRYWLQFQLAGTADVYLPHAIRVAEGVCFGFGSRREKIPITLAKSSVWMLLVGCKQEMLPLLAAEFEPLAGLQALCGDDGPLDLIVPEQPIDYIQRRKFQAFEKMEYKPYSTPVLLSEWLLRNLQYLYKSKPTHAYKQISLYHEALQYIRKHYMDDLSKQSLAEALNVSVRTLTRAFEDRPIKIGDFIHKLKLDKARELLYTTDRPIEDISRELNFSCPKYFSNSYRQHFFESPTEFRLRHGADEEWARVDVHVNRKGKHEKRAQ